MRKIITLILLGLMLVLNTVAFAQEPNNMLDKVEKVSKINTKTSNNLTTNNSNRWILINIPARSLRLYDKDKCIAMYPVGVGKINSKTPVGYFKVVEKVVNPSWTDPDDLKVVIPSGENNPLGYRWLGIGGNYGVHGTNHPESVGHYVSNGCVRMVEADVEKVFDKVEVGTPVQIIYNCLVIDKTFDNRIAYYIYPDGYNVQKLTVDFVKQGLKGYGVADFTTDEAIKKAIELANGQPNFVAGPVNIFLNNQKLNFKAVNYQNLIYVPVQELANKLGMPITIQNNQVTSSVGIANVNYYSNVAYMRLTDIPVVFDYSYSLNKNVTAVTIFPINHVKTIEKQGANLAEIPTKEVNDIDNVGELQQSVMNDDKNNDDKNLESLDKQVDKNVKEIKDVKTVVTKNIVK